MSINGLTNEVLKRDMAGAPHKAGIGGFSQTPLVMGADQVQYRVRRTDADGRVLADASISDLTRDAAAENNMVTSSLNLLVKYIPTEVITLYVATLSAAPALQEAFPRVNTVDVYWGFTIITPLLLFLIYVNKRATTGLRPVVPEARQWPWWQLTAATFAFMVWALAVPGNPYVSGETAAVLAGLGAVFISMILNLLEPIFQKKR